MRPHLLLLLESHMSPEPETPAEEPKRRRGGLSTLLFLLIVAGGAGYVAFNGVTGRHATYAQLTTKTNERSIPTVKVALPGTQPNTQTLDLPGRLEAYTRAALFARVNGYVASWKADIGARVKAGDLLAEIEAPDLDQQLSQAQSDLTNAQANAQLAEVTNQRYQALLPSSAISRQTADEKASDFAAKVALVKSAEANVQRLRALSEFKRIVAPFDGIVTARNTDVGALINSGSASGSELFVVSDTHKLRLYVNVPQNYVPAVKVGTIARLTVPERPGKNYPAKIEATSGAVDVESGATRTQLGVDNPDEELMPGAYASVHIDIANALQVLTVPSSAVIFDKGGLRVATVGVDNRVTLKNIKISRDLGNMVEVSSGLDAADRVIDSPPDDLIDGDVVKVKMPPDKTGSPSADLGKPSKS
jgi:RND family efflux transporter MFP subunit